MTTVGQAGDPLGPRAASASIGGLLYHRNVMEEDTRRDYQNFAKAFSGSPEGYKKKSGARGQWPSPTHGRERFVYHQGAV
jgi:hypothetical protein